MFGKEDFASHFGTRAYQPLEEKSSGDSESDSFLQRAQPRARQGRWSYIPWITTLVFAFISIAEFLYFRTVNYPSSTAAMGTYEAGWATDFGMRNSSRAHPLHERSSGSPLCTEPAKKEIAVENIRFTGSPVFDENGTYWIPNPGSIKYIGEPSPEIDQNWEDATWGEPIFASFLHGRFDLGTV
jgi:hypothetical protein